MQFEWDPLKALSNLRKHGISFDDAAQVFDDPFALRVDDLKHSSPSEHRMYQIGECGERLLVVVFILRGSGAMKRIRIISARAANKRERILYEFNKRIPVS